jgi:hypothetical protein
MKIKTSGKMNRRIKYLKCSQCKVEDARVDQDAVSVVCWRCAMRKPGLEKIKTKK